jgi:hypothetical protein
MSTHTPYAATAVVNARLLKAGLDIVLPPQMLYNYTTARVRKGQTPLIPTVEVDGKVRITDEDLGTWIDKYIAKKTAALTVSVEA